MISIYINFTIFLIFLYYYLNIFIFSLVCIIVVLALPIICYIFSPKVRDSEKLTPYEGGFEPFDDARGVFDLHFFIVGILFILFDLEISFIIPWSISVLVIGSLGFWIMIVFLFLLILGFIFEWRNGGLVWVKNLPINLLY